MEAVPVKKSRSNKINTYSHTHPGVCAIRKTEVRRRGRYC